MCRCARVPHRRLEKVALPDGWSWSGDWVTDYTKGDDEGWEYAINFDRAFHKAYGAFAAAQSLLTRSS